MSRQDMIWLPRGGLEDSTSLEGRTCSSLTLLHSRSLNHRVKQGFW